MVRKITRYTKEEKEKYMKEYKKSRLSISKYTKSVGIPEATFRGWIKKENEIEFGEIDIKEETRKEKQSSMIFATETIKIELKRGYNKKLLRNVMEVLIEDVK